MARYVFTVKIDSAFHERSINAVVHVSLDAENDDIAREFAKKLFTILYEQFDVICMDKPSIVADKGEYP